MANWLAHKSELTNEQVSAIKQSTDRNRIITGAPGSGKTLVLVYRLKYFLEDLKIPASKVRLFVYTTSLREYIKSSIKLLNIPDECVINFDKWCFKYYSINISRNYPRKEKAPDYEEIRKQILKKLQKNNNRFYDFVLVDEGQDLDETTYEILKIISGHITVCLDDKQQIYETKIDRTKVEKLLGIKSYESNNILEAWRCSPYIVKLAAEFIDDKKEKEYFLNQNRKPLLENQVPYIAASSDYNLLNNRMIELIKERMLKNESIAILVSKNKLVGGVGGRLMSEGIQIEYYKDINFDSNKPKVMTYHKAKGLTFDSVFLPGLIDTNFGKFSGNIQNRMIFVGITRAIKWVYMDFNPKSKLSLMKRLSDLDKNGNIKIDYLDNKSNIGLFLDNNIETVNIEDPLDLL